MQRYDCYGRYFFEKRDDGDWIQFADHAAEVHRLNNELTKLTLERDALKRELRDVQELLGDAEALQQSGCGERFE